MFYLFSGQPVLKCIYHLCKLYVYVSLCIPIMYHICILIPASSLPMDQNHTKYIRVYIIKFLNFSPSQKNWYNATNFNLQICNIYECKIKIKRGKIFESFSVYEKSKEKFYFSVVSFRFCICDFLFISSLFQSMIFILIKLYWYSISEIFVWIHFWIVALEEWKNKRFRLLSIFYSIIFHKIWYLLKRVEISIACLVWPRWIIFVMWRR